MHWLEPLFANTTPGHRTLVLCRTTASVQLVRAEAVRRGGSVGLEVLTPMGLALAAANPLACGDRLAADTLHRASSTSVTTPENDSHRISGHKDNTELEIDPGAGLVRGLLPGPLPAGHPWSGVERRRGLLDRLAGHVATAHLTLEDTDACPDALRQLLDAGWARPETDHPLVRLLDLVQRNALPLELRAHQVFSLGFGGHHDLPSPPGPGRFLRKLLTALEATPLAAPTVATAGDPIATLACADVVAEARLIAQHAAAWCTQGEPADGVLVLVPTQGDGDRIRAALRRVHVPVADDDHISLRSHGLGALARTLVPWFLEDDPTISGEDLRRLFASPMLVHQWPDQAMEDEALIRGLDRLKLRDVHKVLHACKIKHAPLSVWQAAFDARANTPMEERRAFDKTPACAQNLSLRLRWFRQQRGPALGDLHRILAGFGVPHTDTIGRAVLAALDAARDEPIGLDTLDHALNSATRARTLDRGVRLLTVARYDGRDCGLLLLAGLHSRGLGAVPVPDPFFDQATLATLGVYSGTTHLDFVFGQVHAATHRARRVLGCVTERDDAGRAVVPVRGLPLQPVAEAARVENYGLELPGPERDALDAIDRVMGPLRPWNPSPPADAESEWVARAATLEWLRSGGLVEASLHQPLPDKPHLADIIQRYGQIAPEHLRPWLGDMRGIPSAGLDLHRRHSVSSTIQPLTHCLYQAFLAGHMRLRERERLEEDLNARDIGVHIHAVMEAVGGDPDWRVVGDVDAARARLETRMIEETRNQLERGDGITEAVRVAQAAFLERWANHWKHYIQHRVIDRSRQEQLADALARRLLVSNPAHTDDLVRRAQSWDGLSPQSQTSLRHWAAKAAASVHNGLDPFDTFVLGQSPATTKPARVAVSELRAHPRTLETLQRLADGYGSRLGDAQALYGPVAAEIEVEWAFGDTEPLMLQLGDLQISTKGFVDRMQVTQHNNIRMVQILDYKTGSAYKARTLSEEYAHGTRPQLVLYALALRQAASNGTAPPGFQVQAGRVALAYDYVKSPADGFVEHFPGLEIPEIDAHAQEYATLLEHAVDGEYPLTPHPETCPALQAWGGGDYCKFADVCRFRRYPQGRESDTEVTPHVPPTGSA